MSFLKTVLESDFQCLLALKGLLLGVVGTTGLLRERVDVLPINPNEDGSPAIADLVIAQDEPFALLLSERRF